MKVLAPKMEKLSAHGEDGRAPPGMMELYRNREDQPLGGCLPSLVQIPVSSALRVLPLIGCASAGVGWIRDLRGRILLHLP